jgi:4-alpha-glucanotransferase
MENSLLSSLAGKQWSKIGAKPHHGIVVPLFSLHSTQSCGIGEFPDLIPLIDWCQKVGFDVIQLLPLNDLGHETSPYGAISAFALNPIHLGLTPLPYVKEFPKLLSQISEMHALTQSQRIDYPKVYAAKEQFLREYFSLTAQRIISTAEYREFVQNNPWLEEYALFKALKVKNQWKIWEEWDSVERDIVSYQALLHQYSEEIQYHTFVQFLCFQQWREVKKEAESKHVFLKGDIPILINRDSADVWGNRSLFIMEFSAGAPPDMYAEEGQNWGFPIYNWFEIEKTGYAWWKERLKIAEGLYHIYRIDHIVGFFRLWSIRGKQSGRYGQFIPGDYAEWIPLGEKILRMMIENCTALPIGEDLGTVPPEVRQLMRQMGIAGTRVMRWERMWNEDRRFLRFEDYIPESMTTVSTHDSETLQQWWVNNPQEAKDYSHFKNWAYESSLSHEKHLEILRDSHHTTSLFHINLLQEYFVLVPGMGWQDYNDERINVPNVVSEKNWSYRFRPSIEEIISSDSLQRIIQSVK